MEADDIVFDIAGRPPVMVDDRHPLNGLEHFGIIHKIRPVGIHHNEKRIGIGDENGIVRLDEGFPVFLQPGQFVDQVLGRGAFAIDDKIGLLATFAHGGADAGRSAHRIQIGKLVAHDEHIGRIPDVLAQGIGHHTGLDLGAFFHFLGVTTIEFKSIFALDDHLIAATGQSGIRCQTGILIQLVQIGIALADAHGDGGADTGAAFDFPDFVQQIKLPLHKLQQIFLFKQKQVFVPVQPPHHAMYRLGPVTDLLIHLGGEFGFFAFRNPFDQLFIAVQHQNGKHRTGALVFGAQFAVIGHIHPVHSNQQRAGSVFSRADDVAIHIEFPAIHRHLIGTLALPLHDPAGIKTFDHIGDVQIEHPLMGAGDLIKAVVAPHHFPGIHAEDGGGQRKIHQGVFRCVIHLE